MEVLELPNKSEKIIDFAWEPKVGFLSASKSRHLSPSPPPWPCAPFILTSTLVLTPTPSPSLTSDHNSNFDDRLSATVDLVP